MSTEENTTQQGQQATAEARDDQGRDRPDLRGPRGNQETEQLDVDRGRDKIERIVNW